MSNDRMPGFSLGSRSVEAMMPVEFSISAEMDIVAKSIETRTEPYRIAEVLNNKDLTIEEAFKFLNKEHFSEKKTRRK